MKINGEIKDRCLTFEEVQPGECFTVINDGILYMKTTETDLIVEVASGSAYSFYEIWDENRPVQIIETEVNIVNKDLNISIVPASSIVCVDGQGIVNLPKSILNNLDIKKGDSVIVIKSGGNIIIRKYMEDK